MANNLVFGWPKPLFFMILGSHGIYVYKYIYACPMAPIHNSKVQNHKNAVKVQEVWNFAF